MNRYFQSTERLAYARRSLAGGVASSLRASMKPTPLFVRSASGPRLVDVDGNEYIDYLLAYGPLILGHAHPAFVERVAAASANGTTYGLQHDGEAEVAQRIAEIMRCADLVALSDSGTAAVMLALRLARAHTGKAKIVRFAGHYHGWSDSIFTAFPSPDLQQQQRSTDAESVLPGTNGQSENSLRDVLVLPWNDLDALETTLQRRHSEIAAVITEPVMCNSGCIVPHPGYLERMRELTEAHGIVLIFDEVITGFRLALGGAQERFGICPDLTTLGKALAGGLALSAVAGKAHIMNLIATGEVNHLGTLNGNALATAAALATLDELGHNNGAVFRHMEQQTEQLISGIRALFAKHGFAGVVNQCGPVFHTMFINQAQVEDFDTFQGRDAVLYARFAECLLDHGVLVRPSGLWYLSTVHTEREIAQTLQAVDAALHDLQTVPAKE